MDTNPNTPLKKCRSHSDVEPETSSPSFIQQPKSSKLSLGDSLIALFEDQNMMLSTKMLDNFRQIKKEEIQNGNQMLLT